MKKVIIVSKTHLDLGFTALASEILARYRDEFFPKAIAIAEKANINGKKFVWTVGSWLLKEILISSSPTQREKLYNAAKIGNIVAHGYPLTTHTELLDKDTIEYGLSIVKGLDKEFNRHTVACKMTDVPGHSISLVPILAKAGMKLLHIGVNGASAVPKVPSCFLWKNGDSEIMVIYEGSYGGEFRCPYIEDILYFDHSADNHGTRELEDVLAKYDKIKDKYKDFEVVAGTLDDYANLLWEQKDKLPIITSEIGDSWIHGGGTDPYKVGAMRELISLKNKWIADGSMKRDSEEYINLADNILCLGEHTWGLDMKWVFGDYNNYLRKDFDEARAKDIKIRRGGIFNLKIAKKWREKGKKGVYTAIQKGWQEQRLYIDNAISKLSAVHKMEANNRLKLLRPSKFLNDLSDSLKVGKEITFKNWAFILNSNGGIEKLTCNGEELFKGNQNAIVEYQSYGKSDYDFWLKHYTRDFHKTFTWAIGDFARPFLGRVDKKYKQGRFGYSLSKATYQKTENMLRIIANLGIEDYFFTDLGASKKMQVIYTFRDDKCNIEVIWCKKPANRLTEAIMLRLFPNVDKDLRYQKIDKDVNPYDVVESGNKNISAVQSISYSVGKDKIIIKNEHSPLISLGKGKILQFDNIYENCSEDGISYILFNNVWGTNFTLWYEDNAYFNFEIKKEILSKL